jgi:plastocyanin
MTAFGSRRLAHRRFLPLAAAVIAAGVLSGCAGGGGTAPSEPVATSRVTMAKSYRFEPAAIRVPVGATVTWVNDDNFTHNVHVLGAAEWTSEALNPGASTSHAFTQAGDFQYQCEFHPQNMKGRLVVGPAS